jgi:hypothetical protein
LDDAIEAFGRIAVVQDAGHGREAAAQREIEERGLQHFVLGGEVIVVGHARGAGVLGDPRRS